MHLSLPKGSCKHYETNQAPQMLGGLPGEHYSLTSAMMTASAQASAEYG